MGFAVMSLTDAAASRVRSIVENAGGEAKGIRISIKKGGCAGMEYAVDLVSEPNSKDDLIEQQGAKVWVAPRPCFTFWARRWISRPPRCALASPSTTRIKRRPAAAASRWN